MEDTENKSTLPDIETMDDAELTLYQQEVERTARNLARFLEIEEEEKTLEDIVFSLEMVKVNNNARNPVEFADMLGENAIVLNAAFQFYLDKAHKSPAPDHKIRLALLAQSQLIRSIATWKRIAEMQNGGTK